MIGKLFFFALLAALVSVNVHGEGELLLIHLCKTPTVITETLMV